MPTNVLRLCIQNGLWLWLSVAWLQFSAQSAEHAVVTICFIRVAVLSWIAWLVVSPSAETHVSDAIPVSSRGGSKKNGVTLFVHSVTCAVRICVWSFLYFDPLQAWRWFFHLRLCGCLTSSLKACPSFQKPLAPIGLALAVLSFVSSLPALSLVWLSSSALEWVLAWLPTLLRLTLSLPLHRHFHSSSRRSVLS